MRKSISLALQGGGSHGAYTWGVLDRLLEDERIHIEAISGTSAGAMNAAVLVSGFVQGGREKARESLNKFWQTIGGYSAFNPVSNPWVEQLTHNWGMGISPMNQWSSFFTQVVSPYFNNPFNIIPLRNVLMEQIDLKAVHECSDIRMFVTATNVRTGRAKIFSGESLSINALLASACLPHLYQAIEINGDSYWDGGYMGNPSIWPLIYDTETADVVLVQINPLERDKLPTTPTAINNRLDEIAFNSSLMHEMRAISFVQMLLEEDALKEPIASRYKNMHIHMVSNLEALGDLGAETKMSADMAFLERLKEMGRTSTDEWLNKNFDSLGKKSTVDIREKFL